MWTLLLFVFLIFLEAFYETQYDSGHKTLSGLFEFLLRSILLLALFAWMAGLKFDQLWKVNVSFIRMILGYLLLRYAFFDIVYNLFRSDLKLPIFYVGNVKVFDKLLRIFFRGTGFPESQFLGITKLASLVIAAEILQVKFISAGVMLITIVVGVGYTVVGVVIGIIRRKRK